MMIMYVLLFKHVEQTYLCSTRDEQYPFREAVRAPIAVDRIEQINDQAQPSILIPSSIRNGTHEIMLEKHSKSL